MSATVVFGEAGVLGGCKCPRADQPGWARRLSIRDSETDVARETHYRRAGQIEICHTSSSSRLSVIDVAVTVRSLVRYLHTESRVPRARLSLRQSTRSFRDAAAAIPQPSCRRHVRARTIDSVEIATPTDHTNVLVWTRWTIVLKIEICHIFACLYKTLSNHEITRSTAISQGWQ